MFLIIIHICMERLLKISLNSWKLLSFNMIIPKIIKKLYEFILRMINKDKTMKKKKMMIL